MASAGQGRELGVGAVLASGALALTYLLLGVNSILVARIEGADATGLITLSTQLLFMGVFISGLGLRTAGTSLVGTGEWTAEGAIRRLAIASILLGAAGGVLGTGAFLIARDGALEGLDGPTAAALMLALPLTLLWWTLPSVALAMERYEAYAALSVAGPAAILVLCPVGALLGGEQGAVIGLAGGSAVGGLVALAWGLAASRGPSAPGRVEPGLRRGLRMGLRAWVNDLFQLVNLRPDLFIVNAYATTADVGVYGVAVTLTSLAWVLPQALASVVLPRSAAARGRAGAVAGPDQLGATATRHAVIVSVVVSIALAAALLCVPLVWGEEFERTVELGLIMLPGVAALGVGRVMVASFTGLGHESYALGIGLLSLPATVLVYLLVVPDEGVTGAALVSVGSYLITSLLAGILFARATRLRSRDYLVPTGADGRDYLRLGGRLRSAIRDRTRRRPADAPR